ncbi:unnamed protein product [Mesocestoides corti]|uniref:t-SNARE coiled-coil homology domain-containing protein n=2 Tax=Mesocestoides corti TaxID=53468 RepID=A0A0R3U4H1_MESCO|nr:unnamed protein product [Mesocestoides corti]
MSELELLRMQANKKTDESLESTRRMVTMAEESHQMGAATMEQLYHQGQQLDRVNDHMDNIHEDIKQTEKHLDDLEKCCGLFVLPWKRVKRPGNSKNFKPREYTAPQPTVQQPGKFGFGKKAPAGDFSKPDGPFIQRILDDDRETEMEQNLNHVSNIVGELKTMAVDMNQEIAIHNQKLDVIGAKTDDNKIRLTAAQSQATRIVGKPASQSSDSLIPKPGLGTASKYMVNQAMNCRLAVPLLVLLHFLPNQCGGIPINGVCVVAGYSITPGVLAHSIWVFRCALLPTTQYPIRAHFLAFSPHSLIHDSHWLLGLEVTHELFEVDKGSHLHVRKVLLTHRASAYCGGVIWRAEELVYAASAVVVVARQRDWLREGVQANEALGDVGKVILRDRVVVALRSRHLHEMKPAEIGATDAELLDFLNDPTPVEKEASAVTPVTSTGRSTLASFQPPKASPGQPQCVDPVTENRLLHNEVASLNQEIANLVKRNRRAEQESQFRMREVESLRVHVQSLQDRLKEVQRIRSASGDIGSNTQTVRKLESQVKKLTATLDQTKQALTESESKASETLKLVDISAGRIEQLQQEVSCAVRSLTAYKEKAAAVLADKEKARQLRSPSSPFARCVVISDLRQQISGGPPTSPSTEDASAPDVAAVQAELQHLREETLSLRQEADKRLLAATEMEEQAFEEHASLRRTIGLLEQQLQREKELRNEADAEILDLQRRLGSEEQRVARVKTDLQSAEAELARMRRVLAEGGGGGGGSASASPVASSRNGAAASSADAEQILAMEARIRQLSDSLVTKQDALDATLAQNHNLKIRLDRLEAESDARLLTDGRSGATFPGGGSQLPQMSHGFARLHLIDTSLPSWVRSIVVSLDAFMIRLVAHLRRRPLIRLLLIVYLFLFHVWLFLGLFFLTPSPPPQ